MGRVFFLVGLIVVAAVAIRCGNSASGVDAGTNNVIAPPTVLPTTLAQFSASSAIENQRHHTYWVGLRAAYRAAILSVKDAPKTVPAMAKELLRFDIELRGSGTIEFVNEGLTTLLRLHVTELNQLASRTPLEVSLLERGKALQQLQLPKISGGYWEYPFLEVAYLSNLGAMESSDRDQWIQKMSNRDQGHVAVAMDLIRYRADLERAFVQKRDFSTVAFPTTLSWLYRSESELKNGGRFTGWTPLQHVLVELSVLFDLKP